MPHGSAQGVCVGTGDSGGPVYRRIGAEDAYAVGITRVDQQQGWLSQPGAAACTTAQAGWGHCGLNPPFDLVQEHRQVGLEALIRRRPNTAVTGQVTLGNAPEGSASIVRPGHLALGSTLVPDIPPMPSEPNRKRAYVGK